MLKRYALILSAVVALVLAVQPVAQAAGYQEFNDVEGHWAADAISQLHSMDIVKGDPDGRVRPDDPITRAEFVALLLRVEDISASARTETPFVDVPSNHWAFGLIQAAKENGIVNGIDATHFGLTENVTREQAVAMIVRAGKAVEPSLTGQTFREGPPAGGPSRLLAGSKLEGSGSGSGGGQVQLVQGREVGPAV